MTQTDEQAIALIKQQGGASLSIGQTFPSLKIEHTTDAEGEPNPLKGHFSTSHQNDLGEWEKTDLGATIAIEVILQHYRLEMVKNNEKYTSPEFDDMDKAINLYKRPVGGQQSTLFGTGTPEELGSKFLKKNDKGRVFSELRVLPVLYVKLNDEIYRWRMNLTSSIAYDRYCKLVKNNQLLLKTEVNIVEDKNGSVKYYVPTFKALEKLTNYNGIVEDQQLLRASFQTANPEYALPEAKTDEQHLADAGLI